MSFLSILQEARQQAKEIKKNVEEATIVVEEKKDDKNNVDENIYIGDAIVSTSQKALIKSKKLNTINSAKRLAKKIASGNVTSTELNKCFKMQERFPNSKNWNYQLVGGDAMKLLKDLLQQGVDLNTALNRKIER